jgi:hypothetical protein
VKLTTYLQLVPSLRMNGAMFPLPHSSSQTVASLKLYFFLLYIRISLTINLDRILRLKCWSGLHSTSPFSALSTINESSKYVYV